MLCEHHSEFTTCDCRTRFVRAVCWTKRRVRAVCWMSSSLCCVRSESSVLCAGREVCAVCWTKRRVRAVCWTKRRVRAVCWTKRRVRAVCWTKRSLYWVQLLCIFFCMCPEVGCGPRTALKASKNLLYLHQSFGKFRAALKAYKKPSLLSASVFCKHQCRL